MLTLPLLLFPILGICYIWTVRATSSSHVAYIKIFSGSLLLTLFNLIHTLFLMFLYDTTNSGFQFKLIISDRLISGVDGISLWLIFLVN